MVEGGEGGVVVEGGEWGVVVGEGSVIWWRGGEGGVMVEGGEGDLKWWRGGRCDMVEGRGRECDMEEGFPSTMISHTLPLPCRKHHIIKYNLRYWVPDTFQPPTIFIPTTSC